MRLISAQVRGFGRLVETKVNLDSKVIAVVGPNEAGKTTLLNALAFVDTQNVLPVPQRSRATSVADDMAVVLVNFTLDDEDRKAVAHLELEHLPQIMQAGRRADGNSTIVITPKPSKKLGVLRDALSQVRSAMTSEHLMDWIDSESVYGDPHSDAARDYKEELEALTDAIDITLLAGEETRPRAELAELAGSLLSVTGHRSDNRVHDYDDPDDLLSGLSKIENWISEPNPTKEACDILWGRTPDFLLFGEADRTLESAYSLDEDILTNTPAALANLASIAELNLVDLFGSMQAGDIARRDTSITKANIRLNAVFAAMWKQSRLSVRLSVDGGFLRVGMWEAGDSITVFSERSAGLRMFVALVSFLRARDSERPPILLIDEAENHLHIDAQADLVNMFVTQEQAVKIIYTTHSPACLPPDLGSAIRSVVPRANNPQISDVKNSFWQGSAGYSPLMLAMGAAAAAFTPARCVVLAEGATEMILLPSLLRAATGERVLEYQVAPGLSEVPKDFYSQLDFEGAKVAYLLDGDGGGRSLAKGLVKAGVPKELIVILGAPGVENVLRPEVYGQAIATLLTECNLGVIVPELPELPEFSAGPWASVLSKWIEVQGLKAPSKVAIANWLIGKNKAEPSTQGADLLKATHESLMRALAR